MTIQDNILSKQNQTSEHMNCNRNWVQTSIKWYIGLSGDWFLQMLGTDNAGHIHKFTDNAGQNSQVYWQRRSHSQVINQAKWAAK